LFKAGILFVDNIQLALATNNLAIDAAFFTDALTFMTLKI